MEIRTVTSMLVTRFDISLAPGDDGSDLILNSKDAFVCRIGRLSLVFRDRVTKRKGGIFGGKVEGAVKED